MRLLSWEHLIPRSLPEAQAVVLWTLPLLSFYVLLAALREGRVLDPPGRVGPITAFADAVQTNTRVLRHHSESTQDDMRVLYFISTARAICVNTPWLFALFPVLLLRSDALGMSNPALTTADSLNTVLSAPLLVRNECKR